MLSASGMRSHNGPREKDYTLRNPSQRPSTMDSKDDEALWQARLKREEGWEAQRDAQWEKEEKEYAAVMEKLRPLEEKIKAPGAAIEDIRKYALGMMKLAHSLSEIEAYHRVADGVLRTALEAMGFEDTVKLYSDRYKYYA